MLVGALRGACAHLLGQGVADRAARGATSLIKARFLLLAVALERTTDRTMITNVPFQGVPSSTTAYHLDQPVPYHQILFSPTGRPNQYRGGPFRTCVLGRRNNASQRVPGIHTELICK